MKDQEQVLLEHGYQVIEEIGKGGFAKVYKVLSLKYQQEFCCKIITTKSGKDTYYQSFVAELDALKQLLHPNVITVYDYFIVNTLQFAIVLEYCPNGSIMSMIKKGILIQRRMLVEYSKQLISALSCLHSNKIAHHDIKPDNILIDSYGRIKLADFGLAEFYDTAETNAHRGSISYCAPEVLAKGSYDPFKADIFSFGVTLYHISCGALPYTSTDTNTLRMAMESEMINPCEGIPRELFAVIKSCMRYNPNQRPTIADIQRGIDGIKTSVKPAASMRNFIPKTFSNDPEFRSFQRLLPIASLMVSKKRHRPTLSTIQSTFISSKSDE